MRAMKFIEATREEAVRLVQHPRWVAEQKMDGTRALALVSLGGTDFYQSNGEPLKHTAATQHFGRIASELASVMPSGLVVLDGEIMIDTGEYRVFDMPQARLGGLSVVLPEDPFGQRRKHLESFLGSPRLTRVRPVRQAVTPREKASLLRRVEETGAEGLVFKDIDAPYEPGIRVDHQRKLKFVKTADLVVMARDTGGAKNARLGAYDDHGNLVQVGACSMIGKPDARPGEVVEVRYLYFTGTNVYQPRMDRIRTDKSPEECSLGQFSNYSREAV